MLENDHPMGAQAFAEAHGQKPSQVEEPVVVEIETKMQGFIEDKKPRIRSNGGINGFMDGGRGYSGGSFGFEDSGGSGEAPLFEE